MDLNLFEFDYDLTWAAFFLNADEHVYGRYGGRDASGPDERISLDGLRHAMRAALAAHQRMPNAKPAAPRDRPLLAENYPAARRLRRGECIHCHQVYEFRREELQAAGRWTKDEVWVYPQPENVGLILDINAGDRVRAVAPDSPAGRAGLQPGDTLLLLSDGLPEQKNAAGEMFDYARVQDIVRSAPADSPEAMLARLWSEAQQWMRNTTQQDDITLIALRMNPDATMKAPA